MDINELIERYSAQKGNKDIKVIKALLRDEKLLAILLCILVSNLLMVRITTR